MKAPRVLIGARRRCPLDRWSGVKPIRSTSMQNKTVVHRLDTRYPTSFRATVEGGDARLVEAVHCEKMIDHDCC